MTNQQTSDPLGTARGIDYVVRIFSRRCGVLYINNVLSISTNFNSLGGAGTFDITVDYSGGELLEYKTNYEKSLFMKYSWFFAIEPMDYVEIFLRGENPTNSHGQISRNLFAENGYESAYGNQIQHNVPPIGIYNQDGNYLRPFDYRWDASSEKYIKLEKADELHLSMTERVNNPDLVFCGFVDTVHNSFSVGENGTNNRVSISGSSLQKYLVAHHVYLPIADAGYFLNLTNYGNLIANRLPPGLSLYFYMDIYIKQYFKLLERKGTSQALTKKSTSSDLDADKVYWKATTELSTPINASADKIQKIILGQKSATTSSSAQIRQAATDVTINKGIFAADDPEVVYQTFKTDTREVLSYNYIGYAVSPASQEVIGAATSASTSQFAEWGRIEVLNSDLLARVSVTDLPSGSVWGILDSFAYKPFNEFFLDEVGNIVLRSQFDAWTQQDYSDGLPISKDDFRNKYCQARKTIRTYAFENWIKVDESILRGWELSRSDTEMSTLITSIPYANVGGADVLVREMTSFPMTSLYMQQVISNLASAEKGLPLKSSPAKMKQSLKSRQFNNFNGFDLSVPEGISLYWARYGIRPREEYDYYSVLVQDSMLSAASLFEAFGNTFFSGTITVKGKASYKVGSRVKLIISSNLLNALPTDVATYIRSVTSIDLHSAADPLAQGNKIVIYFYCTGVSHSFTWGESWTSTLQVIRGEIPGTVSDRTAKLKFINKERQQSIANSVSVVNSAPVDQTRQDYLKGTIKLSNNFHLADLTASSEASQHNIDNNILSSEQQTFNNLKDMANNLLEPLVALYPLKPHKGQKGMQVTSCYRTPQLNTAVGSTAPNSLHITGRAVDIVGLNISSHDLFNEIKNNKKIQFSMIMLEKSSTATWIHIQYEKSKLSSRTVYDTESVGEHLLTKAHHILNSLLGVK